MVTVEGFTFTELENMPLSRLMLMVKQADRIQKARKQAAARQR